MKIAILGTRGIPNQYGGFEQFAFKLAKGLSDLGNDITVYNSSEHSFTGNNYMGINIKHQYCPENQIGSFAHFIYDWKSTRDAVRFNDYDIIYHAGYQSAAIAIWWFRRKSRAKWVTNMDGLEWKRTKWNKAVKVLTLFQERIAVRNSDYLIADNIGIQKYLNDKYKIESVYQAYGADLNNELNNFILKKYDLEIYNYYLAICRIEPENNIETIIEGYLESGSNRPLIIVGNTNTKFGKKLESMYNSHKRIKFIGGIYDSKKLNSLRANCSIYFHGHSVGGTNPSLLEAMATRCLICCHDNIFNNIVLKNNSLTFNSKNDITLHIKEYESINSLKKYENLRNNVYTIVSEDYNWDKIIQSHEKFFNEISKKK